MTADVPAGERQALYSSRSCLFVTTRILVVDQLSGRISGSQIAGMVVLNAHRWVQGMPRRDGQGAANASSALGLNKQVERMDVVASWACPAAHTSNRSAPACPSPARPSPPQGDRQ